MEKGSEYEERLRKAKQRVDAANRLRVLLLCVAAAVLVLVYFGNKFYEGTPWYDGMVGHVYAAVTYVVLAMVAATFAKLFFVIRYNKIVREHHI